MALGCTSASVAEFPWPDLPVLYKITRKASPPATIASAPKAASATRARDTEDQGLINGGGNGCSWDDGLCGQDAGPGEGWASFGSFEVSINTQLTKVELWGKAEQRQAAICSGMTCTIFGVPENITMDPTNPGPLLALVGISTSKHKPVCVRLDRTKSDADSDGAAVTELAKPILKQAGVRLVAGDTFDVRFLSDRVFRYAALTVNPDGSLRLAEEAGEVKVADTSNACRN